MKLGDQEILLSNGTNHMGVPLCSKRDTMRDQIIRRCEKVKKAVNVMLSMGNKKVPLPPSLGSRLYNSTCLPQLVYGIEGCVLDKTCENELEKTHRYCGKQIQGLPPQTPTPVATSTLGWLSIEGIVNLARIMLLYRWLSLSSESIYKKMVLVRLAFHMYDVSNKKHMGPLYEAYKLFVSYDIEHYIVEAMESGITIPLKRFRRLTRNVIVEREHREWKATILLYRGLGLFSECFKRTEICVWWKVSRCRPQLTRSVGDIMRLMCGQHVLACNRGQCNGSKICKLCDLYETETVSHLLFSCTKFTVLRATQWAEVLNSMPDQMAQHVLTLNSRDKVIFLMSGFNGNYTVEWLDIYEVVCNFISRIYMARRSHELG